MVCIYRKQKTFQLCNRNNVLDSVFCKHHAKNSKEIYETFHHAFGDESIISASHIYMLYVYICDQVKKDVTSDCIIKTLFVELLKHIPKNILKKAHEKYWSNSHNLLNKIYQINHVTSVFQNNYDNDKLIRIQGLMRETLKNKLTVPLNVDMCMNKEDPFTYENVADIGKENLFTYYDAKGCLYAFDAIEFDYFIQNCRKEKVEPYNPYTRDILNDKILWKLDMFVTYNGLMRKKDEYRWNTNLQAFTDLSMEIEKQGFYNCPDWFMKISHNNLLKTIKLFKDFSANIVENNRYFNDYNKDSFTFDFCKEGIRLFQECKDDLYILCCNFMKALAMCSQDFYNNLPEWLLNTNTSSGISDMYSLFNEGMSGSFGGIGGMTRFGRPNRFMQNNSDNFLLYYYVEYMQ